MMGALETLDPNTTLKLRLYRHRLNSQGYDKYGSYWGSGELLWRAEDESGNVLHVRAMTREQAKRRFPSAKFYR